MRIAIFGIGGVGGYLGAQLARAGSNVSFVARGEHLAAILSHGLRVTSSSGEMLVRPTLATDDPAEVGVVDAVLLCVKAGQVAGAARSLLPMLARETFVLPLQNGVEATAALNDAIGRQHVIAGLCGMMSWLAGPGHVRTLGDVNFVRFGEQDNRPSERTARLRQVFEAAGINAEIPADIHKAVWEKFLFVAATGGVGAARGETFGEIRESVESRRMLELAMQEICNLACAMGVALDGDVVARTLAFVDQLPHEGTASLQRDLARQRPSELDAWTGAVVRLAREAGVAVPVNASIYAKLLPAEQAARAAQM